MMSEMSEVEAQMEWILKKKRKSAGTGVQASMQNGLEHSRRIN